MFIDGKARVLATSRPLVRSAPIARPCSAKMDRVAPFSRPAQNVDPRSFLDKVEDLNTHVIARASGAGLSRLMDTKQVSFVDDVATQVRPAPSTALHTSAT